MIRNAVCVLAMLAVAGCGPSESSQPSQPQEEVGAVEGAATQNGACVYFDDVAANNEAWTEIQALAASGVTKGCSATSFCPTRNVTRAEMAVFLMRAKYGPNIDNTLPNPTSNVYTDVPPSYWAAKWIKKAADDGITTGCGSGYYCPEDPVTRAQMAVFTQRLRGVFGQPGMRGIYADVPGGYWAGGWVENAAEYIPGCGRNGDRPNFCPERFVSRAEMAQILTRANNYTVPCRNVIGRSVYNGFQVISGIWVGSRLGLHWGPAQGSYNDARERDVLRRVKQMGVGFSVILVNVNDPWAMNPTIQRMHQEGITPVVRLVWDFGQSFDNAPQYILDRHVSAASALYDMGVRIVQIDNEPTRPPAVTNRWAYAEKVAFVMNGINGLEGAGRRMAVGTPPMEYKPAYDAAGRNAIYNFFSDMMWNLKWFNDNRYGGQLFRNAFIATHPYDVGEQGGGAIYSEWFRNTAGGILGRGFNSLATEGGNPVAQSDINAVNYILSDLRDMEGRPADTQCLWIAGHGYLRNEPRPLDWDFDAYFRFDGTTSGVPQMLREYAAGLR
ncbi:S-layer homology domain-containing protein [Pyxidicoccus sp. MSG2]|uniref:S-layer homology domain-containing protein n=1 Tax=Pyxidicoccus sp. MSG2 TaxID=2996790 RepID=UPI00227225AC|nr:S-layer homology domain-containing protein [Pyxidicoccus sp. MSG2]MCY1023213.1 S-layer homology domain-containing protein [Pyxidicoccus sp. MSG2]